MTYPIANVIYGFPMTSEILDVVVPDEVAAEVDVPAGSRIRDIDDYLECDLGFENLYSAGPDGDDTSGYFGVELWSGAYWDLKTQAADLKPTEDQKKEVAGMIAKLPAWFVEAAKLGFPEVQIVWSDS